jgi:hypothetical protein
MHIIQADILKRKVSPFLVTWLNSKAWEEKTLKALCLWLNTSQNHLPPTISTYLLYKLTSLRIGPEYSPVYWGLHCPGLSSCFTMRGCLRCTSGIPSSVCTLHICLHFTHPSPLSGFRHYSGKKCCFMSLGMDAIFPCSCLWVNLCITDIIQNSQF